MKPKKKDHTLVDDSGSQFERLQADHEMFLQAFEKPTQIYRYLRSRSVASPIMLQRTLNYMTDRTSRKSDTRTGFKVDSILDKVQAKFLKENPSYSYKSEFMNLSFAGFYDQCDQKTIQAEVEVQLLKICHKKRKDVSSPVLKVSLGKVVVSVNPTSDDALSMSEGLSVASHNFSHNNGHTVKSYALLFRVNCTRQHSTAQQDLVNGLCNGVSNEELSDDEPSPKRRRPADSVHIDQCDSSQGSDQHSTSTKTSVPSSNCSSQEVISDTYGAELVVYDKYQRCLLTDGEYELALQDLRVTHPTKKQATWETMMDGRAVGPFEVFNNCPTLKFKLAWAQLPWYLVGRSETETTDSAVNMMDPTENDIIIPKHLLPRVQTVDERAKDCISPSKRKRIFYQFLYNNNTRQQTEGRDDLHCPWCSLSCLQLYSLLKHLRTFHARFNFAYYEHPKGARIDVSINQCYDGAYVGNPQDLHSHIGYSFSRNGPVRRTPVTHLVIYRPKKASFDLAEFMEPETEAHSTRQVVQGHNRLYYHTITHQPVRPCEIDTDSEDEHDPMWLRQKSLNMIDEFTDVNEGEKEVMKMWNLHVMHHNILGDCQISKACGSFVEEYGVKLLQQNLVRNFVLHLVNLYDFGLIRPEVMYRTMMMLLQLRNHLEALGHLSNGSDASFELNMNLCERLKQEIAKSALKGRSSPTPESVPSPCSSHQDEAK